MNSALANLAMFNVVAAFAMALTLAVMSRNQRRPSKVSAKLAGCKTLGEAYRLGFRDGLGESPVRGVYNAIVACLAVAIACFLVISSGGLE